MSLNYNGTRYIYVTNIQGDVVAILNTSGTSVVKYTYDAWGNILSTTGSMATTLGALTPLRYRGYVYDTETALYYLQSRYYDPSMGRFICADEFTSTGQGNLSTNMYAYCENNPVSRADNSGKLYNILVGAGVGAVIGGITSAISQMSEMDNSIGFREKFKNLDWGRIACSAAAGAITGGFAGTGIKVSGQMLISAFVGGVSAGMDTYLENKIKKQATFLDYATKITAGILTGLIGGFLGGDGSATGHIIKQSRQAANRILENTSEIVPAVSYWYSQTAKESVHLIIPTTKSVAVSAIPNIASLLNIGYHIM